MLKEEAMKSLQTYGVIYSCIGKGKRYREDIKEEWEKEELKPSARTMRIHLDKAFAGELPLVKIRDKKAFIDEDQLKAFIGTLCTDMGIGVTLQFTDANPVKGKRSSKEESIPSIEKVESPIVRAMRKKIQEQDALLKRKDEEYQALLSKKDQEIQNLRTEIQNDVTKGIVTEMDKKPIVLSSIRSVPAEVFHRDYFLENPKTLLDIPQLVSKYGGERPSFYTVSKAEENGTELTTKNYCSRIAKILFKSKFLEHRLEDEERIAREYDLKRSIYENRLESIQKLLDEDLGNQMKLSLYAGFYEYRGTEMESLLNYAGAHCIEANYVIKLLENPMEFHNYENIRGFLRQACEASEARMKREAARELIAGDWYVVAEYNGKLCRFQMMPVNELLKFRKALSEYKYGDAMVQLEQLLGTKRGATFAADNPDNMMKVEDEEIGNPDEEYYKDAIQMIHEVDDGE